MKHQNNQHGLYNQDITVYLFIKIRQDKIKILNNKNKINKKLFKIKINIQNKKKKLRLMLILIR